MGVSRTVTIDENAGPFWVCGLRNPIWLEGGEVGDEGLTTIAGYLAGPFATFAEAEVALTQCGTLEADVRLAIWTPAEGGHFYSKEPLA